MRRAGELLRSGFRANARAEAGWQREFRGASQLPRASGDARMACQARPGDPWSLRESDPQRKTPSRRTAFSFHGWWSGVFHIAREKMAGGTVIPHLVPQPPRTALQQVVHRVGGVCGLPHGYRDRPENLRDAQFICRHHHRRNVPEVVLVRSCRMTATCWLSITGIRGWKKSTSGRPSVMTIVNYLIISPSSVLQRSRRPAHLNCAG